MKSEWKVMRNVVGGTSLYIPYRVKDVAKTIHSGNIETFGSYKNREEAAVVVERLNREQSTEN